MYVGNVCPQLLAENLVIMTAHVGMPAEGGELLQRAFAEADPPVALKDQLLLAEMWVLAASEASATSEKEPI